MLNIVKYNHDEYEFPCLIVLGCFDGVHIGHAELLKKAKLQAKINGLDLGVLMFTEGKGGDQVFIFEERLKILEQFKVSFVLQADFTDSFKKTKPLDFLNVLEDKLNVKALMSGKDFRFGEGAKGKSSTLKNYAEDEENGIWYMSVKEVVYNDEKVSTTRIKNLLESGDIAGANTLLGRNYFVTGTVVAGADRGGKVLGFPTMNIAYPEKKVKIKRGVYTVKCTVGETTYDGIANYGARPTFGEDGDVLEVYLIAFNENYYGKDLTVEFVSFIREIEKFDTTEALKEQLLKDVKAVGASPAETSAPAAVPTVAANELAVTADEPVEEVKEEVAEEPKPVEEVKEATVAEPVVTEETVEEVVEEQPVEETQVEIAEEPAPEVVEEQPVEEVKEEIVEEPEAAPEEDTSEELVPLAEEETAADEFEEQLDEEYVEPDVTEEQADETVVTDETEPVEETVEDVTEEPTTEPIEETVEEVVEEQSVEETQVEIAEEPVTETEIAEEPAAEVEDTAEAEVTEETTEPETVEEEPASEHEEISEDVNGEEVTSD